MASVENHGPGMKEVQNEPDLPLFILGLRRDYP